MTPDGGVVGFLDNARHDGAGCEGKKMWFSDEAFTFCWQDPDASVGQEFDEVFNGRVIMAVGVGGQGFEESRNGFA